MVYVGIQGKMMIPKNNKTIHENKYDEQQLTTIIKLQGRVLFMLFTNPKHTPNLKQRGHSTRKRLNYRNHPDFLINNRWLCGSKTKRVY